MTLDGSADNKVTSEGLPNYSPPRNVPVSQVTPTPTDHKALLGIVEQTHLEVESGSGKWKTCRRTLMRRRYIIQEGDVLHEDEEEIAFLDF